MIEFLSTTMSMIGYYRDKNNMIEKLLDFFLQGVYLFFIPYGGMRKKG